MVSAVSVRLPSPLGRTRSARLPMRGASARMYQPEPSRATEFCKLAPSRRIT